MPRIHYDLSELFYAMSAKVRFYGIAHTITEVGYALSRSGADLSFVIYSPGHRRFFELRPRLGAEAANGTLALGLPPEAKPRRLRRSRVYAHDALSYRIGEFFARRTNLKRWAAIPAGAVRPIDLNGKILVTISQPRVVSDYTYSLHARGESPRLLPLLHDLMPLHETGKRKYNANFIRDNSYLLETCEAVIANSAFTRDEILRFSKAGRLPRPRHIFTVPLAHEHRSGDPQAAAPPPDTGPEGYLLCVGCLPGRKNLEAVLAAMTGLIAAGRPCPDLVLAGAWRKRVVALVDRHDAVKGRVHYMRDPDQETLAGLYRSARAVVLPSFIEGWGLPAAEALWHGTPALVSDIPVMHEVCGDLGLYFDPGDPEALAEGIGALLDDANAEAALRARISAAKKRLRRWQDVAQDVTDAVADFAARTGKDVKPQP